jgi:cyclic beta-1,2-glucan synthetase
MYRAGLEQILGLTRHGATFRLDPSIPASWPRYTIAWRFGRSRYEIEVENPEHRCRGIREAWHDRVAVDPGAISLVDDGGVHRIRAVIGRPKDKVKAEANFAANGHAG